MEIEQSDSTFSVEELAFQNKLADTSTASLEIHKAFNFITEMVDDYLKLCTKYSKYPQKRMGLLVQLQLLKAKNSSLLDRCFNDDDAVARFFFLHERILEISEKLSEFNGEEFQVSFSSNENSNHNIHDHHNHHHLECESSDEEEEDEEHDDLFECPICYSEYSYKQTYKFSECNHRYCKECCKEYYKTLIADGDVSNMRCLYPQCETFIPDSHLRKLIGEDLMSKYEKISLIRFLNSDPNAHWCPYPDCDNVMIAEPGSEKIRCNICYRSSCVKCKTKWHPNMTCEENIIAIQPEDPKTAKWKKKNGVKACPHCGLLATRVSGCPDMICSGCKLHWDWDSIGKKEKETLLEKVGFAYPRLMKEVVGSRDTLSEWEKNRKATAKDLAPFLIASTIFLAPVYLVAGPPAFLVKKRRARKAIRAEKKNSTI